VNERSAAIYDVRHVTITLLQLPPASPVAVPPVTGILGKTPSDVLYSEGVFKGSDEEALYPAPERRRGPELRITIYNIS
jgi:hypothetical protein